MPQADILTVVVASPSDVMVERNTLHGVIDELNLSVARREGLQLRLIRWETDSHPGFHPDGPQGLINSVLKIEDCDIFVGIFWKRFGTPVKDAGSGTEAEFLQAYNAWKKQSSPHIMFYFNQAPVMPATAAEAEQLQRVIKFKEAFPKEGLWWSYNGEKEFEKLVRSHTTKLIYQYAEQKLQGSHS